MRDAERCFDIFTGNGVSVLEQCEKLLCAIFVRVWFWLGMRLPGREVDVRQGDLERMIGDFDRRFYWMFSVAFVDL